MQGRAAETPSLFEEAKAANPAYRDSILVEVEALVRCLAGDFTGVAGAAQEAVAWLPVTTARRRTPGPAYGAMSAVECGDRVGGRAPAESRSGDARPASDWSFYLASVHWGEAILTWYARGAADCVPLLRSTHDNCSGCEAWPLTRIWLFDLAEAAADAGDAAHRDCRCLRARRRCAAHRPAVIRGLAAAGSAWASVAAR